MLFLKAVYPFCICRGRNKKLFKIIFVIQNFNQFQKCLQKFSTHAKKSDFKSFFSTRLYTYLCFSFSRTSHTGMYAVCMHFSLTNSTYNILMLQCMANPVWKDRLSIRLSMLNNFIFILFYSQLFRSLLRFLTSSSQNISNAHFS